MKKIALIAFLLAVCVAAGRAQESRQDISLSGTALIEPFIASSTDVQVHSNTAYGALLSYRFMLTPISALEANYGITYQNKINYYVAIPNHYQVMTRTQEISAAYVRSFTYRKFNPFVEAGPGALIFLPIRNSGTTSPGREAADLRWAAFTVPALPTRSAPASTSARSIAALSPRCPRSATPTVHHQQVVQHLQPDLGVAYHF